MSLCVMFSFHPYLFIKTICRLSMHKEKKSPLFKKHGSILRHVTLRGVSAQLQSAAERVNAGKPTSMVITLHKKSASYLNILVAPILNSSVEICVV